MKKTRLLSVATAIFLALSLFSCGSTKKIPEPPVEPVTDNASKSYEADDNEEKVEEEAKEVEKKPPVENPGTFSAERIEKKNDMVGVKKPAVEQKSGDYPNMDRGNIEETRIPLEAPKKKVAVAKKTEDIVIVDNLPNIVQENENVLFSSDWDEETVSAPEDCGYFYTTDNLGEFSMIKGEFRKLGGYEGSTVGFVFGFSPTKDGWLKNYIRFEINTRGEYGIYSWDGKRYTDLVQKNKPDTAYLYESGAINAGYNRKNTLTIQKQADGTYTLSINDKVVAEKVPPLKNGSKGVMAFFSVGKEEQEHFPEDPVTVTYRITESK